MTSEPTRRTLTGLPPRTTQASVSRLIRANRASEATTTTSAEAAPAETQTPELTDSATPRVPKYLQLRRREARVYDDQADALTTLTRRLNKARQQPDGTTVGERITDNTLLRIAIDLLLTRADDLHGTTEQELANSLGLAPRPAPPNPPFTDVTQ